MSAFEGSSNQARERSFRLAVAGEAGFVIGAAMKESIDMCDAAFNGVTAANYLDPLQSFGGATPRISLLYGLFGHSQEGYGAMTVYLRSKSMVPPSSAGRGGMGKGKGKQ